MISVCVPFYPWYREVDRSPEVFDVLVKGLNEADGARNIELCLTDAGVEDVWAKGKARMWDHRAFHKRLHAEFKGRLNYMLCKECINVDDSNQKS